MGVDYNLLGTACAGAAVALKERMEREQISGTVRVYGCPAEEIVIGKIRMNEQGYSMSYLRQLHGIHLTETVSVMISAGPGY